MGEPACVFRPGQRNQPANTVTPRPQFEDDGFAGILAAARGGV
jgi:hypothetical protein